MNSLKDYKVISHILGSLKENLNNKVGFKVKKNLLHISKMIEFIEN